MMLKNANEFENANRVRGGGVLNGSEAATKPLVVAGNGPSLAEIDYSLLPDDFDCYRCNQFYFEEKYYLGSKIKGVFFNHHVFFEQYYTLGQLQRRGEYEVDEIYCSNMQWLSEIPNQDLLDFLHRLVDVTQVYTLLQKCPKLADWAKYNDLFLSQRITSGVVMMFVGAIKGYKKMYLTGIDFYEKGEYAFEHKKEGILRAVPGFSKMLKDYFHTKQVDLDFIFKLQEHFGLEIYALSPNSALAEIFPLPERKTPRLTPKPKPENYICDLLFPEVCKPWQRQENPAYKEGLWAKVRRKIKRKLGLKKS